MFRICWFLLCTFPVLWWLIGPIAALCVLMQLDVYYRMLPRRGEVIRQDAARAAGFAARGQEDRHWNRVAWR
jgi:hypothetical protein